MGFPQNFGPDFERLLDEINDEIVAEHQAERERSEARMTFPGFGQFDLDDESERIWQRINEQMVEEAEAERERGHARMGFPQYIDPEFEAILDEAEEEYYRKLDGAEAERDARLPRMNTDHVVMRIGQLEQCFGAMESTPTGGLRYEADTPEEVNSLVDLIAEYRDLQDHRDGVLLRDVPTDEFLRRLMHKTNGASPYAVWGEILEDSREWKRDEAGAHAMSSLGELLLRHGMSRDEADALVRDLAAASIVTVLRVDELADGTVAPYCHTDGPPDHHFWIVSPAWRETVAAGLVSGVPPAALPKL